ncbi:winged helix-turn-helix transcriptional regulator [Croceicoccus bisphenolivorans]|uniref:winged helix-turn-helix transcriptional regulator n=1 Tax=Croceicoccus bisphenolivorans TaxID=1783232 RepID=UPI000835596D|nr:winged helix-turn-helix transcriptional regulator [Croceicoccus bisphenolivorans]
MKFQKDTNAGQGVEHGRWYGDACGAAFAMELIGERWSLLVMRELMLGALRFSQIRANLPGISAKVLTERLEKLEGAGLLTRRMLPPPASAQVYELTEWGYQTEEIMQVLGRWSVRSPCHDPTLPLTPVSAMLSLRTMIDPVAARDIALVIDFVLGAERFVARLAGGELRVSKCDGASPEADLTFDGDTANALLPYFYGKRPLAEVEAECGLRFQGDRELADRFAALFALPPKNAIHTKDSA